MDDINARIDSSVKMCVLLGDEEQHKGHGVHPAIAPRPAVEPLLHRA